MPNLSPAQIMDYASAAGFSGADLATAVAIALAESGGNPNAYNPETAARAPAGKGSYGLWQIYLNLHPEFTGANLYDPQTNALAAYAVYAVARGFSPWTTYTSGKYRAYLNGVPLVLDASTGLPVTDGVDAEALAAAVADGTVDASLLPTSLPSSSGLLAAIAVALGMVALYLLEG
jgi:Lysozyme like domain